MAELSRGGELDMGKGGTDKRGPAEAIRYGIMGQFNVHRKTTKEEAAPQQDNPWAGF